MLLFFMHSNDTKTIVCSAVTGIIIRDKKTNGIESLKVLNGTVSFWLIMKMSFRKNSADDFIVEKN